MRDRTINSRYLSTIEACEYTSLSRTTLMKLAKEADSLRRIGRKILIDKITLDEYLSEQSQS